MTYLLVASIATVVIVALVLSTIAVVTRLRPRACSAANAGSSLAAAAFLMLAATAVLHTAGPLLRLVAAYVMGLVQTIGHVVTDAVQTPLYRLLPQPADLTEALMDLMPAFFGVFVLIFAGSMSVAISRTTRARRDTRPTSAWHVLFRIARHQWASSCSRRFCSPAALTS